MVLSNSRKEGMKIKEKGKHMMWNNSLDNKDEAKQSRFKYNVANGLSPNDKSSKNDKLR